jgi:hypothetical protein
MCSIQHDAGTSTVAVDPSVGTRFGARTCQQVAMPSGRAQRISSAGTPSVSDGSREP